MSGLDEGLDTIRIGGISGHGWHGVLPAERERGQQFVVDVVVGMSMRRAGLTDSLADTVDYSDIAARVHGHIVGEPWALLESLAQAIAADCLSDPAIHGVQVTVHKPQAPISVPFRDVSVRVVRAR